MIVHVRNTEPCWVVYRFEVLVPDGLSDEQAKTRAIAEVWAGVATDTLIKETLASEPEIVGSVEGIDQKYEVTHIERDQ